jgi:hypothetical protein
MAKNRKWIIIAVIIIAIISAYNSCTDGGDFDVYLQAARQLTKGQDIYAPPFIRGLQYFYSVFFALLLSPFGTHVFITEFLWLMLSYLLLLRIKKLITAYFDIDSLSVKQKRNWLLLSILLSLQFIMYEIALIQVTIFLLWAILESLRLIQQNKPIRGGMLLGLVINIKIMPILILPYLFYRGYFKAIIVCIACFVALLYLPALFIGWGYNNFLLSEWWRVINPANKEHMFETGIGTHSLVSLLPVYLTPTIGEMPYKRNLLNLDHHTVDIVLNVTRLFFLSLSLFFFRSVPFKKENNKVKTFWEISFFTLLIPLLFPHQNKYDFLLAIPMIVYLLYFFITTFNLYHSVSYKLVLILFIFIMTIFSPIYGSDIIGVFLFRYTQHYRFLTIAAIILIPIALYCSPSRQIKILKNKIM